MSRQRVNFTYGKHDALAKGLAPLKCPYLAVGLASTDKILFSQMILARGTPRKTIVS